MKNISLNIDKVAKFVSKEGIAAYEPQVKAAMETLEKLLRPFYGQYL